jgi:hypothetical protein
MAEPQILHNVQRGVTRLMSLPRDVAEAWPRRDPPIELPKASTAHRELFRKYEVDLHRAVQEAMEWWQGRLTIKLRREKLDRRAALMAMYEETIGGPASAPEIIFVVRMYWLACEALNPSLPRDQWVAPEVFLLGWLADGKHERQVEVLSGMIYWPIGLDAEGRWV